MSYHLKIAAISAVREVDKEAIKVIASASETGLEDE